MNTMAPAAPAIQPARRNSPLVHHRVVWPAGLPADTPVLDALDRANLRLAIDTRLRRELVEYLRVLRYDAHLAPAAPAAQGPGSVERAALRGHLGEWCYGQLVELVREHAADAPLSMAHVRIDELTLDSAVELAILRFDLEAYRRELAPRLHAAQVDRAGGQVHPWMAGGPARVAMAAYWAEQPSNFALQLLRSFLDPKRGQLRLRSLLPALN